MPLQYLQTRWAHKHTRNINSVRFYEHVYALIAFQQGL